MCLNTIRWPVESVSPCHLTPEQRRQVTAAFQAMKNQAQELGPRLIEEERQLDKFFAHDRALLEKTEIDISYGS